MVTGIKFIQSINPPDTQCTREHVADSVAPKYLQTAKDYFIQGNYDYDKGNCKQAILDYSKSIVLDPNFAQAYDNRAYTYMRMQEYKEAMLDLNKAIEIKPIYVQALMNRGDLYNYYGPVIDRRKAIEDYNKVISLGAAEHTSVCGHRAMAENNNILPLVILRIFTAFKCEK